MSLDEQRNWLSNAKYFARGDYLVYNIYEFRLYIDALHIWMFRLNRASLDRDEQHDDCLEVRCE